MVKLSVIIPVYNVADRIEQTLDTVRRQTFKDWECICVDDGSYDGSGRLLDQCAISDPRFRVYHNPNAGVSAARNFGLAKAKGEYVTFVDGDDLVADYRFEDALRILDAEKVDLLRTNATIWKECDEMPIVKRDVSFQKVHHKDILSWGWEIFLQEGQVWHLFVRRDKVLLNSFPEGVRVWEDTIFCLRLLDHIENAVESTDASYIYRLRASSAWHQNRAAKDTSAVHNLIVSEFEKVGCKENRRVRRSCARALWNNIFDWIRFSDKGVNQEDGLRLIGDYLDLGKKELLLRVGELPIKWRIPYLWLKIFRSTFAVRISILLSRLVHRA